MSCKRRHIVLAILINGTAPQAKGKCPGYAPALQNAPILCPLLFFVNQLLAVMLKSSRNTEIRQSRLPTKLQTVGLLPITRAEGFQVKIGGPALAPSTALKSELAEICEVGGDYLDAVARHNPDATIASRGCSVGCRRVRCAHDAVGS